MLFPKKSDYVPEIDKNYKFDRDTTLAIISGFAFNKEFWFKVIMAQVNLLILSKLLQG